MSRISTPPNSIQRQQGWTFWSLLFTLSVLIFFAYIGMQLVPVFAANENIKNAMEQSMDDVDLLKVSRGAIITKMNGQLYLDGSHQLLNYKTDLLVRRSKKIFTIETHYKREIPLFFNLSLVAQFDNVIERELSKNRN